MKYVLSKSKYIRGLQCLRALYLDIYQPSLARYSREALRKFDAGREFEYRFKDTFPGGVDVSALLGRRVGDYPETTARLLDEGTKDLFEAGFCYDEVLVLADVVHRRDEGSLDIFEVKSGSVLSETYRRDAAVQYYVISNLYKINQFSIVHNDGEGGFSVVELTSDLQAMKAEVQSNIERMKASISGTEPDIAPGDHCTVPYECPYRHHCEHDGLQLGLF